MVVFSQIVVTVMLMLSMWWLWLKSIGQNTLDIFTASDVGDLQAVRQQVKCGVSVDTKNDKGFTPLCLSSENNHLTVVQFLVERNADPDLMSEYQKSNGKQITMSPLMLSSANGKTEIIDCLLQNGAEVNLSNNTNKTALYYASQNGHLQTLQCLISHRADVNIADDVNKTPLWIAARMGHTDIVSHLAEAGADVNTTDLKQRTPLEIASEKGHLDTVACLGRDHKNIVEVEKTDSCIIPKDILNSYFIENIAKNILKKEERKEEIEKEVPKKFQGKEDDDYLQEILKEINNNNREIVDSEISDGGTANKEREQI